jgi:hypothetical protein
MHFGRLVKWRGLICPFIWLSRKPFHGFRIHLGLEVRSKILRQMYFDALCPTMYEIQNKIPQSVQRWATGWTIGSDRV